MPEQSTQLLPDDILNAILVLAKKESGKERFAFRGHGYTLQDIFFKLAKERRGGLLDVFVYSESGPEPFCPVLNESLSRLQLSGLVGRENPDYEVLFLQPSSEVYYDKELSSRFETDQIDELKTIAELFLKKVTTV